VKISKAGIIIKRGSEKAQLIAREMADWLKKKNIESCFNEFSQELDILIILGGDGTLLHAAYKASKYQIPVVGVNLGNLGFLTEIAESERYQVLEEIISGSASVEKRIMLKARLYSGEAWSKTYYALNDVVVTKGTLTQLVRLSSWANGEYVTTYRADGLIFSTPTGATAYNLSAGGPIVHPRLDSIILTPICPFMLESRPLLLPSDTIITTKLLGAARDVKIVLDGRNLWDMHENDQLEISVAEWPLNLICPAKNGYFEILRNKLNWGVSGE
jgi:NAD+ kinase